MKYIIKNMNYKDGFCVIGCSDKGCSKVCVNNCTRVCVVDCPINGN
ncbi:Clo7bot family Cys-rich peptide [Clostridium sp. ATCC 25772]|uniref:Clo7bot family Cys-rich peptide n=1 Tax=Clostridium senegalense TaxID=1465809 RepID=A0A6M0GZ88_9CLOT|nr:Clo7bot family Cys-rich peptide [Clostridium sp. ATCC 25772]NEU03264.1 Clo7bot family Cys-rich peptide [Clostridium senegalense]